MNIHLLTIKSEQDSAKRLGFPVFAGYDSLFPNVKPNDIVIRWGNSYGYGEDFKNVVNPGKIIASNCNKFWARKQIGEVVDIPKIYEKSVPKGVTAVVRPKEHSCGNDFEVKVGPFNVDYYQYASDFIDTDKELRVWFANGKTFGAVRVPWQDQKIEKYNCRSKWAYKYTEISSELSKQTLKAAAKIGLITGAADVLKKDGKYYFLELNSAPTIDTCTIERFFRENLITYILNKWGKNVNLELK
jgi:predicted ATP-grasp superfamily ATP-dependent carboligase